MSETGWWLPHSLAGWSSCSHRPQLCSAEQRIDEEARREERRDKKKNAPNSIKSKGIAPKRCTGDLYGVLKLSRKRHGSIWTQTPGISVHVPHAHAASRTAHAARPRRVSVILARSFLLGSRQMCFALCITHGEANRVYSNLWILTWALVYLLTFPSA